MPRDAIVATQWGLCRECRKPGLALTSQYGTGRAVCGFCGGALRAVAYDLTEWAEAVIAEPLRREPTTDQPE